MLELAGVTVAYARVPAVRDLSLRIDEAECVALIGPNGAGKSTTLRAISGLVPLQAGRIRFLGRDLDGVRPHLVARRGIAHVPEGRRVFPELTVEENLLVGSTMPAAHARRQEGLVRVWSLFPELAERRGQLGGTLSGGEQQMLAVARGLMLWPQLLMLDEPSLGLAPIVVSRLFARLAEIHRLGVTILLVEQNIHRALRLAERAYVLEGGQLVLEGPSAVLLRDPRIRSAYLGT